MKTKKLPTILVLAGCVMLLAGQAVMAGPVGTAWTYQGRLIDANNAADGLYDFQFKLFDANSDGNQLGSDVNKPEVDVIDGYFTVELDFGNVFDGNECWLDIGVRPGELEDPNVYTELSPRQAITPAPYALYALDGGGGSESLWQANGTSIYYNNGNVGIGTTAPAVPLHIKSGAQSMITIEGDSPGINPGIKFIEDGGQTSRIMLRESLGNALQFLTGSVEAVTIKQDGKVGIGTTIPSYKLDVSGDIRATGVIHGTADNADKLDGYDEGSFFLLGEDETVTGRPSFDGGTTGSTSPFTVDSTYVVSNLNADLLDGQDASAFASSTHGHYSLDAADGSPVNAVYVDNDGKVGIGKTAPNEQLEITGNFRMPSTTGSTGIIKVGGDRFIHNYGVENTFIGRNAGNLTMAGYANTAIGCEALLSNTNGTCDSAIGYRALNSNTTGYGNSAMGSFALNKNTEGGGNSAMGDGALHNNTTGSSNSAMGSGALYYNTTGYDNSAMGSSALSSNTTGNYNSAMGGVALYYNTTGSHNSATGYEALFHNTTGNYNTAVGSGANYWNEDGSRNTIIGYEAGYGESYTDESGNVFIGYRAGYNETGSNKLYIANSDTDPPLIYGDFSTGRIGIGTKNTSSKLNIVSSSEGGLAIERYIDNGNGPGLLQRKARGSSSAPAVVNTDDVLGGYSAYGYDGLNFDSAGHIRHRVGSVSGGNVASYIEFTTSDRDGIVNDAMRIDPNGKVGIGTTEPYAKLHVNESDDGIYTGRFEHSSATNGNGVYIKTNCTSSNAALRIDNASGQVFRVENNGKVGIGTTSPQGALDVSSNNGAFIVPRMTTAQRNALTPVNGMIVYDTTDNKFYFRENGAWATK
jgi:hypothetical protein